MDAESTLPEMPLTLLDTQGVEAGLAICTSPGSWLGNIVPGTGE